MKKLLALAFVMFFPVAMSLPGIAHAQTDPGVRPGPVNGQPGAVFYSEGRPIVTYSFAADGGKIREIYTVINPEKLASWEALSPKQGEK